MILLLGCPSHQLPFGMLRISWHQRDAEMLNTALQSLRADVFWQLRRLINDLPLDIMWWGDPGWRPGAPQSCSITPLLSWTGERKYNYRLVG